MANETDEHAYNPLDRQTFEMIAYNAVGRGSEINAFPIYHLTHSTGRSGWSVGCMQWDFGQPGRQHKVADLLSGYQSWAPENKRFTSAESLSLSARLQTPGRHGNALSTEELLRLNEYLRSDPGRDFVSGLDREQIVYKWENVGQPLSQTLWLQELGRTDPRQAAEIVTMASKRFNQGEKRGRELLRILEANEMSSDDVSSWIENVSTLGASDPAAIISGRDSALTAVRLISDLELGHGRLSEAWHQELHVNGNIGLTRSFNSNPDVQLFDGMMRNPAAGARIAAHINEGTPARPTLISGSNQHARLEMSRIEQDRHGVITIQSPNGDLFEMTRNGWNRNGVPMQMEFGGRREADWLDLMENNGMPFVPRRGHFRNGDSANPEHIPHDRARPSHSSEHHSNAASGSTESQSYAETSNPENASRRVDPRDRNHPDHGLYEALRKQLPPQTSDNMAAHVMLQAKIGGVWNVDELDKVIVRDDRVFVMGTTPGFRADVYLSQTPPPMQETTQRLEDFDKQRIQQHEQWMAQEQQQSQDRGMRYSL